MSKEESQPTRGHWGRSVEFFLSCASLSVGLGNVWRFPTIAYENGGGAFLIPYLIVLLVIGRPLYYMELIFGQFSGLGHVKAWKAVPAMRGIGYAQMFTSVYMSLYYNFVIALAVRYFVASASSSLPWTECQDHWFEGTNPQLSCDSFNINGPPANHTAQQVNLTLETSNRRVSVPELYWKYRISHQSEGLWDIRWMSWELALCMVFVYAFIALSVIKGVKTLGKLAYFTAIFPYAVLISLLVVACLQEGALDGIKRFFTPEWHKLLDVQVWYKACEQSFFSLGVGYGFLIMFSGYNDFKKDIYRDAILLSILDTFTSVLAGTVVFAVLGGLSAKLGVNFNEVINAVGTELVFIVYPEALSKIEFVPQLWSALFFVMLFTLGVGSSVAFVESIFTAIRDQFPLLQKRKWVLVVPSAVLLFFCGLPLATDAGQYIVKLLDNYGVATAAFLYAILESISIMWIYGIRNFSKDAEFMLDRKVGIFWKVTWGVTAPVLLIGIFIYGNVLLFLDGSGGGKGIPWWGNLIGWMMAATCLIQIPIWMFVVFAKTKGATPLQKVRSSFKPAPDWGPRNLETREKWREFKDCAQNNMLRQPYQIAVLPEKATYTNPCFDSNESTSF
ncbi:sodium-dependent nutrient amino acid transporter 1-like [Ornithodoros turicata]|uniref:sodium-dependent nutrient amino acid transporter 1-like n=1 Tax=Ornithodoros turicata TaxID=34597 RepID=UPI00313A4861